LFQCAASCISAVLRCGDSALWVMEGQNLAVLHCHGSARSGVVGMCNLTHSFRTSIAAHHCRSQHIKS